MPIKFPGRTRAGTYAFNESLCTIKQTASRICTLTANHCGAKCRKNRGIWLKTGYWWLREGSHQAELADSTAQELSLRHTRRRTR